MYPYARVSNYEEKEMCVCSAAHRRKLLMFLVKMMAGDMTDVCDLTAGE